MAASDIVRMRIHNQLLGSAPSRTPEDVVAWMGAMQAQDYSMAKWGIGVRLPGSNEAAIEEAIDEGRILRTHIMRPTWHFVAATDMRWMMDLTGPRIRNSLNANNKRLGLTEEVFTNCNGIITSLLEGGRHMTRPQIMKELQNYKIATDDLRGSHIMYRAEIDGVVCSGARIGKECSYALYDERVPAATITDRAEAVGELFRRYFTSHGPATLQDFVWWSGLSLGDARAGLEINRESLESITTGEQTYWFVDSGAVIPGVKKGEVYLLPAFDEYLVSYKDRSHVLKDEHFSNAISGNGIFWPVVVVSGRVAGTWKRSLKKERMIVEPAYFETKHGVSLSAIGKALKRYGAFVDQHTELAG